MIEFKFNLIDLNYLRYGFWLMIRTCKFDFSVCVYTWAYVYNFQTDAKAKAKNKFLVGKQFRYASMQTQRIYKQNFAKNNDAPWQ